MLAMSADVPALMALVERSFRALGARDYPPETVAAAAGTVIKFDPELVGQGRVFVIEDGGEPVACAGWSGFADWLTDALPPDVRRSRRSPAAGLRPSSRFTSSAGRHRLGRSICVTCGRLRRGCSVISVARAPTTYVLCDLR
jgi:hypothetical protein